MLQLPSSTLVNRKIPKSKFYEQLQANTRLKELFTQQVEAIYWKYKLSKETIRLEPKDEIEEIQVFEIRLKKKSDFEEILRSIDKVIPYPILYMLVYEEQAQLAIAYKERNQKDEHRSVVHAYYYSEWKPIAQLRFNVIQGLNLKAVYENMIRNLLEINEKPETELAVALEQQAKIEKLTKECERLEAKIRREKQFHRKVDLNIKLQQKRKELKRLQGD